MKAADKIIAVSLLAAALAAPGAASAQEAPYYGAPYAQPLPGEAIDVDRDLDYARVVRVIPVTDVAPAPASAPGRNCTTREEAYPGGGHVAGDGRYPSGDYYGADGYHGVGETAPRNTGTEGGRTMASVLGTVVGAVVGSQVGGGSARYATAAIGSAVGGIAGRQVYDNAHRDPGPSHVTVCDPVDARYPYPAAPAAPAADVRLYDVVYEYAGRLYRTRTDYDPGERIRVRVDVRPE